MRRRILASYLMLVTVVLVVLLVPLATTYRARLRDDRAASLQTQAFLVAAVVEDRLENPGPDAGGSLDAVLGRAAPRSGERLLVTDRTGRVVADLGSGPRPRALQELIDRARTGRSRRARQDDRSAVAVPVASNGRVYGTVVLSAPLAPLDRRVHRYWSELAAIAAGALIVVGLTGLVLARSVTKPLDDLRVVADGFGGGDLGVRARTDAGPPELRVLADDFNRMAQRLEMLVRAQAEFAGDASHELRTPLTALRLQLENAATDAGERGQALLPALAEVERLSRLVEGLLVLSRALPSTDRPRAAIDVAPITAGRVETWSPLAAELGLRVLHLDPEDPVRAAVDPDRLAQVLDNLIANALDATAAGGTITVGSMPTEGGVTVHVIDDGPGLSDADRVRAFDRFWRGGRAADDGGLGGSGLGLAIVTRLVAADDGTVRLEAAPGGGIDAVIDLPRQ